MRTRGKAMNAAITISDLLTRHLAELLKRFPNGLTARKGRKTYQLTSAKNGSALLEIAEERSTGWKRTVSLQDGPPLYGTDRHWYGRVHTRHARHWEENLPFIPTNGQLRYYVHFVQKLEWETR